MKILFNMTQKHIETKRNMRKTCTQTPKKGKFPIGVANFVIEKNFLRLGVDHMRQYDTRNQSIIEYDRYIK